MFHVKYKIYRFHFLSFREQIMEIFFIIAVAIFLFAVSLTFIIFGSGKLWERVTAGEVPNYSDLMFS